jgi:hypothetical protein
MAADEASEHGFGTVPRLWLPSSQPRQPGMAALRIFLGVTVAELPAVSALPPGGRPWLAADLGLNLRADSDRGVTIQ